MEVATIKLADLKRSGKNVRKTAAADHQAQELAASIGAIGLLHNLVVKKNGKGYEVVDGGRRLEALRKLKIEEAPCLILDDEDAGEVSVAANIIRADLHPMDEAAAIAALIKTDESVATIAARFGRTEKWVRQRMQLTNLDPRIQKLFREDKIDLGDAVNISTVPLEKQKGFLDENDGEFDRYEFRHVIYGNRIDAGRAIFDLESLPDETRADLDIRRDLFSGQVTLGNFKLFISLQEEALEQAKEDWLDRGYNDVVISHRPVWDYESKLFTYSYWDLSLPTEDDEGNEVPSRVSAGSLTVFYHFDTDRGFVEGPNYLLPRTIDKTTGEVSPETAEEPKEPAPDELTKPQLEMLALHATRNLQNALVDNPALAHQMIIASTLSNLRPGVHDYYSGFWHEFKVMPHKHIEMHEATGIPGHPDMIREFLPEPLWDAMTNNDAEAYDIGIQNLFGGWAPFMSSGDAEADTRMAAAAIAMKINPDSWKHILTVSPIHTDWMTKQFLWKYRVSQLQQAIAEMGGKTEHVRKKDLVQDVLRLWKEGKRFRYLPDEYLAEATDAA